MVRRWVSKLRNMTSKIANWYRFLRARRLFLRVLIEDHLDSNCHKYPSLIARYRGTSIYRNLIHEINQDRLSKRTNYSGTPVHSENRRVSCFSFHTDDETRQPSPTYNRGYSDTLKPVSMRQRGKTATANLMPPPKLTPSFSTPVLTIKPSKKVEFPPIFEE